MATLPTPNSYDTHSSVLGSRRVSLQFTAGTAGAAPTTMTHGNGYVSSVVKSSNDYTLNLRQKWNRLANYNITIKQATFDPAGAHYGVLLTDNVAGSTPSITVDFVAGSTGAIVPLATGDIVYITVELSDVKP